MRQRLEQHPRLGDPRQPLPERWIYVKAAREHRPTRTAVRLSEYEVQQARAMYASGAVKFTIAAHFSIPRSEVGRLVERPFRLRADVSAPFETPAAAEESEQWLREEIQAAHAAALKKQVNMDWSEAKKEDKARSNYKEDTTVGCDYCEHTSDDSGRVIYRCDCCGADCCSSCSANGDAGSVLCDPDPATHPGRGCWKEATSSRCHR